MASGFSPEPPHSSTRSLRARRTGKEPNVASSNVRTARPISPVLRPIRRFVAVEAAGGILLLVATLVALTCANSPWAHGYEHIWETEIGINIGSVGLSEPLRFWINDGLMAVFFFVIGLEIKRELLVGELASWRQAALPIVAALGGVAVPAGIYAVVNAGGSGAEGWGIPMATDTAFALGILALLGSRIPVTLTIFLTALAIFDDISALLVIAVFYTEQIAWAGIAAGALILGILAIANWAGLRHPIVYGMLGVGLWLALLHAGVHPTLAGVVLAAMIPAWSRIGTHQFLRQARDVLHRFEAAGEHHESVLANVDRQAAFLELGTIAEKAETPLQMIEHRLHPWATFVIMSIFALANAGLPLSQDVASGLARPVGLGIVVGLAIGKPLGIVIGTWLATRSGLTALPSELRWRHILGMGCLGGIGFTMSLFVADLAFDGTSLLSDAKIGILTGSIVSGLAGWMLLRGAASDQTTTPTVSRTAAAEP